MPCSLLFILGLEQRKWQGQLIAGLDNDKKERSSNAGAILVGYV
jgi:hypothetical protein